MAKFVHVKFGDPPPEWIVKDHDLLSKFQVLDKEFETKLNKELEAKFNSLHKAFVLKVDAMKTR